jgi:uncharacterized protein (TIGR02145 family)
LPKNPKHVFISAYFPFGGFIDDVAVKIDKARAASTLWNTYIGTCTVGNNLAANNATGFSGLPGGYRYTNGSFVSLGNYGYFWSSSETSTTNAWRRILYYNYAFVYRNDSTKGYGFSIRCLRG